MCANIYANTTPFCISWAYADFGIHGGSGVLPPADIEGQLIFISLQCSWMLTLGLATILEWSAEINPWTCLGHMGSAGSCGDVSENGPRTDQAENQKVAPWMETPLSGSAACWTQQTQEPAAFLSSETKRGKCLKKVCLIIMRMKIKILLSIQRASLNMPLNLFTFSLTLVIIPYYYRHYVLDRTLAPQDNTPLHSCPCFSCYNVLVN